MKRALLLAALILFFAVIAAGPAAAGDVRIRGDFNNRFMIYTNHADWLHQEKAVLHDGTVSESWGEAKYRMWFDAASNGGKVKGIWGFEIGSLEYGKPGSLGKHLGGSYSGDAVNVETRWLYTDFQLPGANRGLRVRMGLQPLNVNSFYWKETIMGVKAYGSAGPVDWVAAWLRPVRDPVTDDDRDVEDMDAFYLRANLQPAGGFKPGFFAVYHHGDSDNRDPAAYATITSQHYEIKKLANKFDTEILALGTDGSWTWNNFFARWDFIYETGSIDHANFKLSYNGVDYSDNRGESGARDQDFELNAWLLHFDLGFKTGAWKFTYTFWYASGDDDPSDDNFDGFMAVDIDRNDNICLFKATYVDDDAFTEKDYLLDKGFVMNKLAADCRVSKKMTVGAAVMYMLTAEDVEYGSYGDDEIGWEVDAYFKYRIYDNLEFACNAGYLFTGDAIDFYERESHEPAAQPDGDSDENIFVSTARVRYKF